MHCKNWLWSGCVFCSDMFTFVLQGVTAIDLALSDQLAKVAPTELKFSALAPLIIFKYYISYVYYYFALLKS